MIAWIGLTVSAYVVTRMVELVVVHRDDTSLLAFAMGLLALCTIGVALFAAWVLLTAPTPIP